MTCETATRFFLRDGTECPEAEFHRLFSDWSYRQIACDQVGDKLVSTVWLGCNLEALAVDHEAARLIFGTGVLPDGDETRYATEAEAIKGHKRVVERVRGDTINDKTRP